IFNKGAVMVLPSGVNKGTGLRAGLGTLGLSEHAVVGIGDAENDHSLLKVAGLGVAVANAIPALKDRADLVVQKDHGAGVVEVMERMLANDLSDVTLKPRETGA
ncbi:MAG: phosphoglycolate phosphatase, partial [Myxococcales bacterium]